MYTLNPTAIFNIENGIVVVTIPLTQRKFKLTDHNFIKRIYDISQDSTTIDPSHPIDQEFIKTEILIPKEKRVKWDGDQLSLICHHSTRNMLNQEEEVAEDDIVKALIELGNNIESLPPRYTPTNILEEIPLPSPDLDILKKFSLDYCIRKRKTCRDFFDVPAKIQDLSTILHYNFGYIHGKEWEEFDEAGLIQLGERKSSPSSTGLQCSDAFVVIMNVEGIEPGIYFYDAVSHSLNKIPSSINKENLSTLLFDQYWCKNISFGIFITVDLRRVWIKDIKPRGYISAYIEVGHISQNLQLSCVPLNLSTWITGTFRDKALKDILCISEEFIFPAFFFGAGLGSGSAIPRLIKNNL